MNITSWRTALAAVAVVAGISIPGTAHADTAACTIQTAGVHVAAVSGGAVIVGETAMLCTGSFTQDIVGGSIWVSILSSFDNTSWTECGRSIATPFVNLPLPLVEANGANVVVATCPIAPYYKSHHHSDVYYSNNLTDIPAECVHAVGHMTCFQDGPVIQVL